MTYPAVSEGASQRELTERINRLLQGKMNAVTTMTLTANAGTTTLTDSRIGSGTFIGFSPTTANAATAIATGDIWVSGKTKGSATFTHANNAQTDRTYDVLLIA